MTAYAEATLARPRAQVATGIWRACTRHLADLRRGPRRGLQWAPTRARWAISFFGFLQHWKGKWAGQPLTLEPWEAFIVGSLFGWLRRDGTRRFRAAYIELPRKNGKSTLGAGLALLVTFFEGEPGAEGYCVATARRQAKIVFDCARQFALRADVLRKRLYIGQHAIALEANGSKLESISKDTPQQHGFSASFAIIDEVHAHRTSELIDVVETSMAAREQPLLVEITTAGVGQDSICWQHHSYTERMLEGVLPNDDAWFGFIVAAEPEDDYTSPAVWRKANPNFGISVNEEYLRDQCRKARELVTAQNTFKRAHLNIWTEQAERWLDLAAWDRCGEEVRPFGGVVYGGLDLAATRDLTTIVWLAEDEAGVLDVRARFWVPSAALARRDRTTQVAFKEWVAAGLLTVTEGDVVDYGAVRAAVLEDAETYRAAEIGFDPWNCAQLAGELQAAGLMMVPVRPGYATMHDPTAALGERVVGRTLRHGGHPILRWMASNMVVMRDHDGRIKPDRKRATEKIDGIVGLIMGLDRLNRNAAPPSVYEDRDVMIIEAEEPGGAPFPPAPDEEY